MKKYSFIIWLSIAAILIINLALFRNIYNSQIIQQKNLLFKESKVCSQEIESVVKQFESDLNYILYSDDISAMFDDDSDSDALKNILFFYSTYHHLIKNIDIYDNNKNGLNVFRNNNNFINDRYLGQRQRKLFDKEKVIREKSNYQYILPVFKDSILFANVLVTINLNDYILSVLNKFHLDDYTWEWLIDIENKHFYNARNIEFNIENSQTIFDNLSNDLNGLLIHNVSNDSLKIKMLSVYSPMQILNRKFGISMSIDYSKLKGEIISKIWMINLLSIIIFIVVIVYLARQINALKKKIKD